jgi:magnesium-transporting ATPase (P-type)
VARALGEGESGRAGPRGERSLTTCYFLASLVATFCLALLARDLHARQAPSSAVWRYPQQANATRFGVQSSLAAVYSEIEQGLQLLGMTGIEDRLQDNVSFVINFVPAAAVRCSRALCALLGPNIALFAILL